MAAYADTWQQVDCCSKQTLSTRQAQQQQQRQEQAASFFADKWQRCNKATSAGTSAATAAKDPDAAATHNATGGAADWASMRGGDGNIHRSGSVSVDCSAFFGSFYWNGSSSSSSSWQLQQPAGHGSQLHLSRAQRVTNRLLVVLQHFSLGPGILLLSFLLLADVLVGPKDACGLHMQQNVLTWLPRGIPLLGPSFIGFFALSTILAPLWFWLGSKVQPATYIRAAALLVAASYLLAFVAMYATGIITLAIALVGCTNLVSAPILSMGLLGEEGVHVFEVGRSLLTLGECVKYGLLAAAMAAAAAATSALPLQLLAGCALLAAVAIATWLCCPAALTPAYSHMSLNYRRQWLLLTHLRCFWLSLAAGACDTAVLLLTGFLVVAVTDSLAVLAAFQAIAFGCSAAAVLWNWRALSSRVAELHLNRAMLLLAGLPLYQAIKAAVLLARLPTGVTLGVCAVIDVAMGGRSSILGLASFVTLPSREVVSMWQFLGIMVGSGRFSWNGQQLFQP
eukprot:GHRQ01020237.1.p1 GENE.GHRQ01020237.1~~GHRQ01020237.1.p1  ORF type:complete len:597 (+),score=276.17 GHRQ01020237.1:265-1791(+)